MNRNYLPPSLMQGNATSSAQECNESSAMMITGGGDRGHGSPSGIAPNMTHSPMQSMYGGYQGSNTALQQHQTTTGSSSISGINSCSGAGLGGGGGGSGAPNTTRRSISFTGGVPSSHMNPYTQMLSQNAPQMAHQSSAYLPQMSLAQGIGGSGIMSPTQAPPLRYRFGRTCKLPTVQEGKLHARQHLIRSSKTY